jgi:asparagine synthase (glutamine-hydrolysing)
MCGIAGIIDLSGQRRPVPSGAIRAMASAIVHRGPDEDGFLEQPGLALASRRLSIVGLADGRQPIRNEDGSVAVVFNGELFDYPEMKAELEARGHTFRTHCDTEIIPHRWEDHQEGMFEHLRGQFALALWDQKRQRLVLGRDRFGICPLYWSRQGDWLVFGSEIKAILASGLVPARPDPRGINHLFTFFSLPGPVTCFEGVQYLPPGRYLKVQLGAAGEPAHFSRHTYWEMDFPDKGDEDRRPARALADDFEQLLLAAVSRRLRADVPVVSYLSGGVDSSTVVALASHVRGSPIPSFTIQIKAPKLDETTEATLAARHIGTDPIVVGVGAEEVLSTYPELIRAAEGPVVDTSCAALLLLAREVHNRGFKVAQTGEGADEWLAGYPWHKFNRALGWLDVFRLPLSQWARRSFVALSGAPRFPWSNICRSQQAVGGHNGWLDIYGLMSMSKLRFFSPWLREQVLDQVPYEDLELPRERMVRWHPLNRELALSARAHLAGLLLNAKGDRVAMHSSVETRYPFLDEAVFAFLARVPPRYKLRGLLGDKYLLRLVAERWLPHSIAWRRKAMFRAPFDSFHLDVAPPFVEQLLSEESLVKTGYFDVEQVTYWRRHFRSLGLLKRAQRVSVEMGLVGVLATQLWHHTFQGDSLCELPSFQVPRPHEPARWDENGRVASSAAPSGLGRPHSAVGQTTEE